MEPSLYEQLEIQRSEFRGDITKFIQDRARRFLRDTGISVQRINCKFISHLRVGQPTADDVLVSSVEINLEI